MKFTISPTPIDGLLVVDPKVFRDERGFFLESYHKQELAAAGLVVDFVQDNHSRSSAGVLRGLHYQSLAAPMGKLVRCTRGVVFDVAVDLRVGSPTFAQWYGLELSEANHRQLWVPVGFAHGFLALSDWADLQYKCSNYYTPQAEGAVRWNDPEIGIDWPVTNPILSARDAAAGSLADYREHPAFRYPIAHSEAPGLN